MVLVKANSFSKGDVTSRQTLQLGMLAIVGLYWVPALIPLVSIKFFLFSFLNYLLNNLKPKS
jgi:hypothetical protein